MKKLILPAVVFIFSILLIPFSANYVHAQEKEPIGCEKLKSILGSDECPHFIINIDLWCAQTEGELSGGFDPQNGIDWRYKNRPPDYVIDRSSDFFSEDTVKAEKCLEGIGNQTSAQSDQSQSDNVGQPTKQNQTGKEGNPLSVFGFNPLETWRNIQNLLTLNEMVVATADSIVPKVIPEESAWDKAINNITGKGDSKVNSEVDPNIIAHIDEILNRTPEMTEEIINQYKAEQEALYEGPIESPYRLDIQNGDIAIKLPGQTEWSALKQGDRIPSGSTIFTGMDSTTVLSIRDKGVIQVQSFTEITVTEKGLEEAAKTGQTYTDIELRTGEVELNLPSGIFTGSLQVHTPNFVAGVRGTHFWVSYDKDKKLSTTGVYKGEVEVTVKGSDQSILVSPNGDKPGVVVVAQKLSPIKLAIGGLILILIVVGGVLVMKKKLKFRGI